MSKLLDISEDISKELKRREEARKKFEEIKKNSRKNSKFCSLKSSGLSITFNREKFKVEAPRDDKFKITIDLEKKDKMSRIMLNLNKTEGHNQKSNEFKDNLYEVSRKSSQNDNILQQDSCSTLKEEKVENHYQDKFPTPKVEKTKLKEYESAKELINEKKVQWADDIKVEKPNSIDVEFLKHPLAEKENSSSEKINKIKIHDKPEETDETKSLLREILKEIKESNEKRKRMEEKLDRLEKNCGHFSKKLEWLEKNFK